MRSKFSARTRTWLLVFCLGVSLPLLYVASVCSEEGEVQASDRSGPSPAALIEAARARRGTPNQPPPGGAAPGQPGGSPDAPAGTPAEGAPSESKEQQPIKRPTAPPEPPNKKEFDVKPDDRGYIQFQFRNQAWPDVLKWLAEVSSMSLDWQELPPDFINLATQRPYTIDETRDLFNRHLLARGFTILEVDGVLQISKTTAINPALVPKVQPRDLASLPPHRFVRVSFPLSTLVADQVIEEFKALISPNGKLIPLASTNRLEAMDAAGNLFELYRILQDEESESARDRLAREFSLTYVRAIEVKSQLETFLGIETKTPKAPSSQLELQLMMQQQQMQMQQQQQMAQSQGGGAKSNSKKSEVFLVANPRKNSVIVHAPPDKLAIVESFIRRIDVPSDTSENFRGLQNRMRVFRLASLSPTQLVSSLIAMDALEPTTRLEVDDENKAIIAYASLADQYAIQQVIDRLDGSARKFEVLQLRRLKADDVAGTIKFLLNVDKDKKNENQNRRYYYYDPYANNQNDKKGNDDAFRVGANVEDNQLLLWANEIELEEVNKLLVKLGEISAPGSKPSLFRTIDATRSPETLEYLKRIRNRFESIAPNQIILPSEQDFIEPESLDFPNQSDSPFDEESRSSDSSKESKPKDPARVSPDESEVTIKSDATDDHPERSQSEGGLRFVLTEALNDLDSEDSENRISRQIEPSDSRRVERRERETSAEAPSSIRISIDSNGNLLLSSDDVEALDQLESLMLREAPPKRPYEVFQVVNTRASWIRLNLEDYFKEDKNDRDGRDSFLRFYWFDEMPDSKKDNDPQLGKRKPLKFISDNDTNTIIAIGASDSQRKLIRELIQLWDTPDKNKAKDARYTKLVPVKYSRAESIEQAVKDAYRDFLSQNDKVFDRNSAEGNTKGEAKREASSNSRKFSLGVDKITNTLVVSAEGEDFLNVICEMITKLDEAAKPSGTVQVFEMDSGGSSKSMEKALKALLETQRQQPPNQPGQNNRGQGNSQNNVQSGNSNGVFGGSD